MTYSILSSMTLAGAYSTALSTARTQDGATPQVKTDAQPRALYMPRNLSRWLSLLPVFAKTARG